MCNISVASLINDVEILKKIFKIRKLISTLIKNPLLSKMYVTTCVCLYSLNFFLISILKRHQLTFMSELPLCQFNPNLATDKRG